MIKRLKRRLTAVCAISTGLVLVAMALVSLQFSTRKIREQYAAAFDSERDSIFFYLRGRKTVDHTWLARTETAGNLWIAVYHQGEPLIFNTQNEQRATLTTLAGQTAAEQCGFALNVRPTSTLNAASVGFELAAGDGRYQAVAATVPSGESWYGVVILKDSTPEREEIWRLRLVFAATVTVALICLTVVARVFTAWAVKPVEESRQKQSEFISAASHELRSPLAVIRASAGAIRTAPPAEAVSFAEAIDRECDRLGRLTGDLLTLAASESHAWSITKQPTEPQTLLLTAGERFEALAAKKKIRLSVDLGETDLPVVLCDSARVDQLLSILLENAIRHTPENGEIRLCAGASRRSVTLSVVDSGPGVPDADKANIFQRFYRGDAARTDKEHYGLGLAVAAEIAALHKGSISVTDAAEGGAEFTLRLPRTER